MKTVTLIFSFIVFILFMSGCGRQSGGLDQLLDANNPNISAHNQNAWPLSHIASFEGKMEILTTKDIVEKDTFYSEKQKMESELHQIENEIEEVSKKIEAIKSSKPGIFGTIVNGASWIVRKVTPQMIEDALGIEETEELETLETQKEKLVKSYEEKSKVFTAFKEVQVVSSLISSLKLSIDQGGQTQELRGTLTLIQDDKEYVIQITDMAYDLESEALSFSFIHDGKKYSFESNEDKKSQDIFKDEGVLKITLRGNVDVFNQSSEELLNVGEFSLSRIVPLILEN